MIARAPTTLALISPNREMSREQVLAKEHKVHPYAGLEKDASGRWCEPKTNYEEPIFPSEVT